MVDNNKLILVESYNKNASSRDDNNIVGWKLEEVNKLLTNLPNTDCKILDLGAGSGIYSNHFRDKGMKPICIDISQGMVDLCLNKNLEALVMDFFDLKFDDDTFDAIWSLNTILHVAKADINSVLLEIKRVLRPGGLVYIGLYGGDDFEGIWENDFYTPNRFFSFYTDQHIHDVVSKHFDILSFESLGPKNKRNKTFQSILARKKSTE